eukprot:1155693-Pelagomonas_calceolata.AAC.6
MFKRLDTSKALIGCRGLLIAQPGEDIKAVVVHSDCVIDPKQRYAAVCPVRDDSQGMVECQPADASPALKPRYSECNSGILSSCARTCANPRPISHFRIQALAMALHLTG